jgi:hypothetical protein
MLTHRERRSDMPYIIFSKNTFKLTRRKGAGPKYTNRRYSVIFFFNFRNFSFREFQFSHPSLALEGSFLSANSGAIHLIYKFPFFPFFFWVPFFVLYIHIYCAK